MTITAETRSHVSQNPVRSNLSDVHHEVHDYVSGAIRDGSRLPDAIGNNSPIKRKALIVAPLYKNHVEIDTNITWPKLKSTATDVMLMHKMLIRFGYEKQNIRILSDVCGGFHGLADPTRENIFSSLDWLASDTAPGDYRFFHFSGHGERILQDKDHGQAKQARRVVTDRSLREPGALFDNELDMKGYGATPTRITEQTILTEELAYYNEAIVTRNTELRPGEQGPASRIMDHELNNCLSKLPPESILTCVIDCCASGRILNTNTKVSGAGFRGRRDPPVRRPEPPQSPQPSQSQPWPESQPQPQTESRPDSRPEPRPQPRPQSLPQFLPQPSPELNLNLAGSLDGLEEETNQEELISSQMLNGSINIASELAEAISSVLPGGVTSDVAGESSGLALQRDFYIKMQEEIPIKERQMDHIQAKIFVWTGCHQRQDTWGHDDQQPYGWGIFTRVFTQAFEANLAALTNNHQAHNGYVLNYNELFIHISKNVLKETMELSSLQFVQLWTSMRDVDDDKVKMLLREVVVI